jgi:DNA polymerase III subunit delta
LKVSFDQFPAQLNRALPPICLIAGDETLLVNEASDLLRERARQQGFSEREVLFVERGFDWNSLRTASQSLSLFADRRLIEVRLNAASPGVEGSEVLVELAERAAADTLILLTGNKLDSKSHSARWVTAIEKHGVFMPVWPVEAAQLPAWIAKRLQRAGLRAEHAVASLIAERVEGNLLAAQQEIDKLVLLHANGVLTAETVLADVADSARFEVLQLGIAAMQGNAARALRILEGLRQEGVDATLALWAVNKDLQWLTRVEFLMRRGQSADAAMTAEYVWRPRQAAMKQALARLKATQLRGLLVDAAQVDAAIKGVSKRDPWLMLQALVARLAGTRLARVRAA